MSDDGTRKVALVTGASSGIGEATALEYAKLGYRVAITGRNLERLNSVLRSLVVASPAKSAADFLLLQADFEEPAQVEPIVDRTVGQFGRLDVLVNNAGYSGRECDIHHPDFYQDFQNILQVNLFAATRLAQLAVPELKKSKGVIVNVTSVADRMPMPTTSYSVSKAGVTMLTKTLANALDGTGVRVVSVAPGPIKTNFSELVAGFGPLTSLQRVGESKEVAEVIVFLSSDKASYVHGCTIDVDGGCSAKYGGVFSALNKV